MSRSKLGLGIFVRKQASKAAAVGGGGGGEQQHVVDVSTNDYVLRPVDYDLTYSLFYPHPPEKRETSLSQQFFPPTDLSQCW